MSSALLRFRIAAYLVGVVLLLLVLVAMPLKYLAGDLNSTFQLANLVDLVHLSQLHEVLCIAASHHDL